MKYRPEIDGLRALAVIPVVLFHAGCKPFQGGFIGVDIFFVISGYLITVILLSDLEAGTFSLTRFYARRVRRIVPALFLVMGATLLGAWVWLPPSSMVDFSRSVITSSLFVSNVSFWLEAGYWGTENSLKPLLHTWTLAIEAQFYLLFPLLLLAILRFGRRWMPAILLSLGVVSFGASFWATHHFPSAAFFLLPTRLWELLIGAGVGYFLLHSKPLVPTKWQRLTGDGLAMLGMVLTLFAIFSFKETLPFPGTLALFPVLGTALLILFAGPHNLVGYWLSRPWLVGIGVISYSVYLWHHPLLSLARHASLMEPSLGLRTALVLVSFPLAYLSWRFVEKPFRNRAFLGRRFWLLGLAIAAFFCQFGIAGYTTDGFAHRFRQPIALMQMAEGADLGVMGKVPAKTMLEKAQLNAPPTTAEPHHGQDNYGLSAICDTSFTLSPACRTSDAPEILVWGDSFAMQLIPGILASQPDARLIQMTKSACGPFFDVAPIVEPDYPVAWSRECLAFTEQLRGWLRQNKTIRYAVLASPFSQYFMDDTKLLLRNGEHHYASVDRGIREFENTLAELKSLGITPVIFSPPPAAEWDMGQCLSRAQWLSIDFERCNLPLEEVVEERTSAYSFLSHFVDDYRVIWLDQLLCDQTECKAHLGDIPLYRDRRHLSREGAAALGQQFGFYQMITGNSVRPNHPH